MRCRFFFNSRISICSRIVRYSKGYASATEKARCFIDADHMAARSFFNIGTLDIRRIVITDNKALYIRRGTHIPGPVRIILPSLIFLVIRFQFCPITLSQVRSHVLPAA
ncbi:hypothetical protein DUB87_22850 [Salmonella enterica subsp. houtenae serovar Houten]|nr:hypothetical protein [Salmonella enterica]EBS0301563.1 hypothetical protein [Salmonella enterica subsp. houtenae serovar Houten]